MIYAMMILPGISEHENDTLVYVAAAAYGDVMLYVTKEDGTINDDGGSRTKRFSY